MPRLSFLINCLASYLALTRFATFAPLELEQSKAINKKPLFMKCARAGFGTSQILPHILRLTRFRYDKPSTWVRQ